MVNKDVDLLDFKSYFLYTPMSLKVLKYGNQNKHPNHVEIILNDPVGGVFNAKLYY